MSTTDYHDYLFNVRFDAFGTAGIYSIIDTASCRVYVGSTTDFMARLSDHFMHLELGDHFNRELQYAYVAVGASCFSFNILEVAPADFTEQWLEDREQVWMDRLSKHTSLFNKFKASRRSTNVTAVE